MLVLVTMSTVRNSCFSTRHLHESNADGSAPIELLLLLLLLNELFLFQCSQFAIHLHKSDADESVVDATLIGFF